MALEHAILGFLDREPMTGYDLKTRCFDTTAGHVWTADQAQVYRTLDRLRASGLVRSRLVTQRGKPDRRLYTITPTGREELARWVHTPEEPAALRDPFLLQLMFSADLEDTELVGLLSHARDVYQDRLDTLDSKGRSEPGGVTSKRQAELRRMTLEAGTTSARSAIDWIEGCLDRVESGKVSGTPAARREKTPPARRSTRRRGPGKGRLG